jgi:hypothetical protein
MHAYLYYSTLHALLAEEYYRLKDATSSKNIKALIIEINNMANRMMPLCQSMPPNTGGEETTLLATLRYKLTK